MGLGAGKRGIALPIKKGVAKMKWFSAILVLGVLISQPALAAQAPELPNLNKWFVRFYNIDDFEYDGVYDAAIVIVRDTDDNHTASARVYAWFFRPVNLDRIDLAAWLQFTRSADTGTITEIRFLFYGRDKDKMVLIEEFVKSRPKDGEPTKEPLFREDSEFGRCYFDVWRQLGFTDEDIRKTVPSWNWLTED
jgi:hypothetical protein